MPNAVQNIVGKTLYDAHHKKLGTIDNAYVTRQDEQPVFASLTEGLLDARIIFVPVAMTHVEGDSVVTTATKDIIADAPSIRVGEELDQEGIEALYSYYGPIVQRQAATSSSPSTATPAPTQATEPAANSHVPDELPAPTDAGDQAPQPQFNPQATAQPPSAPAPQANEQEIMLHQDAPTAHEPATPAGHDTRSQDTPNLAAAPDEPHQAQPPTADDTQP